MNIFNLILKNYIITESLSIESANFLIPFYSSSLLFRFFKTLQTFLKSSLITKKFHHVCSFWWIRYLSTPKKRRASAPQHFVLNSVLLRPEPKSIKRETWRRCRPKRSRGSASLSLRVLAGHAWIPFVQNVLQLLGKIVVHLNLGAVRKPVQVV